MYTSGAYFILSIIIALTISFAITYLIYKRKRSEKNSNLQKWLFGIRWLAVALVILVLFNPSIEITSTSEQKPLLYFLEDNSASIENLTDSSELLYFQKELSDVKKQLNTKYNIKTLYFDGDVYDTVNTKYKGAVTDIGRALNAVLQSKDQTVNDVVLVSDGNYNQGENPIFLSNVLPYRLYAIALGDTVSKLSVYFQNLYNNHIGYTNEQIPVEANIRYEKLPKDTVVNVQVLSGNKVLKASQVKLLKGTRRTNFNTHFNSKAKGIQKFTIRIESINESARSFYIDVKEQKQKVLILYHSVHPDIGLIKRALSQSNRFEPVMIQANEFKQQISDYSLIILHQIPSGQFAEDRWFAEAMTLQIPTWVILGAQTDLSTFNQGQNALQLTNFNGQYDEAGIYFNNSFTWFNTEFTDNFDALSWPPLRVPFATYEFKKGTSLFNQSLMGINSDRPAWLFVDQPYRYAILTGTGIWKWGIYDYRISGNHNRLYDLIYKTVRFLSLNKPKKRLQLHVEPIYESVEPIEIEAVWYNKNYQQDNSLSGNITLKDSANKEYIFAFVPFKNKYKIQAGLLPAGKYIYKASVKSDEEVFSDEGQFVVSEKDLEKNNYNANTDLLRKVAGKEQFIYYKDVKRLVSLLDKGDSQQIIIKTDTKLADLIDEKLLLFIIIVLFAIEWAIRKYNGQL
ncbi:MAG: hypothetical protein C0599_09160 [Salinivirgaceae bacterium]|nr:MAG: hypothetical protein C0599_09160 [Salinivirgaceae bacterium]